MSFTIGTATFTNGSTTVSAVSLTSGKLSYFASGTAVFVDGELIEAISADAGLSEIKLRLPYSGVTGSYDFVAFDTIEGLRDAVQSARNFAIQLENTAASVGVIGNMYEDTTAGLDETTDGQYFNVAGSGDVFSTLYLNDNGVAVAQSSIYNTAKIDTLINDVADNAGAIADNASDIQALQALPTNVILY